MRTLVEHFGIVTPSKLVTNNDNMKDAIHMDIASLQAPVGLSSKQKGSRPPIATVTFGRNPQVDGSVTSMVSIEIASTEDTIEDKFTL